MHFLVISGYNDQHPISIDETELLQAVKAQLAGNNMVAVFKNGTIVGGQISKIVHDLTKVEKIYNPNGPDRLPKGAIEAHQLAIENAGEIVKAKMENRAPVLKEVSPVRIHTRGMKSIGDIINTEK